ncbi:DEAD/DEAH box helicase [Sutcliffiella rhizosphaerae]|uniref:DEAD-box ATP-dependent RNA helicase CshB n=1 Tax=Sutcliffiella rhizosphaerae TaxID=2880967 RepID=A0ABM8YHI2_9BACI|nr:DEAD/DEAH box helicase [Sutcliffiella rhizosphaerae]CAG9619334.1 DEAD-box ATP-dependent RNA helicase CshB [Sutcliffiella rhizosphaerae]
MTKNFERFPLKPFILNAIKELRFQKPTEVQERMIPALLNGESAIGQSQTGTGKTHAFLLPIINNIDPTVQEVQAVITAPTRELANQIYQEVLKITKFSEEDQMINARCYVGGTDKQRMIDRLKQQPHIVVGTPGRIKDLMVENALLVHTAKTIVVDEADLMLDMGFIEDVDKIAAAMPEKLQILVFSATIPEKLKPFLRKYMENPKYTHVAPKQITAEKIKHQIIPLKSKSKTKLLHDILVKYNPFLAIVFTNTKKKADEVADSLLEQGLRVGRIHGDLNPRERKKMMKQINDLEFQYVVATDLAARGIDIEGVSHVVNFELPTDLDFYVHRVGRTARADYSGIAVTIYEPSDEAALSHIENLGIQFTQVDLKAGELVEIGPRNKRKNRKKQVNEVDIAAKTAVKKSTKVKPGYKKKHKYEVEQYKKRQRRLKKR